VDDEDCSVRFGELVVLFGVAHQESSLTAKFRLLKYRSLCKGTLRMDDGNMLCDLLVMYE
jgi:hypothetical protein